MSYPYHIFIESDCQSRGKATKAVAFLQESVSALLTFLFPDKIVILLSYNGDSPQNRNQFGCRLT